MWKHKRIFFQYRHLNFLVEMFYFNNMQARNRLIRNWLSPRNSLLYHLWRWLFLFIKDHHDSAVETNWFMINRFKRNAQCIGLLSRHWVWTAFVLEPFAESQFLVLSKHADRVKQWLYRSIILDKKIHFTCTVLWKHADWLKINLWKRKQPK